MLNQNTETAELQRLLVLLRWDLLLLAAIFAAIAGLLVCFARDHSWHLVAWALFGAVAVIAHELVMAYVDRRISAIDPSTPDRVGRA
jgi:hypothetical protein